MVIGVAEVSVVEEPNVTDVEDLVVRASKELSEVLTGLEQISQPYHSRQVTVSSLEEMTSQPHLVSILLVSCLYNKLSLEIGTYLH